MNDIDILKLYYKGEQLEKAIEQYEAGIPAAYILGEWEFCGDRYFLNEDCLIPRCDTERVVEEIISKAPDNAYIADLCTGSGCIAISSIKRIKNAYGFAVDISENAVEMAKRNAVENGVDGRIEFVVNDVFELDLQDKKFDVIVSNPPYIPTKDLALLDEYVKKEPTRALDGGNDGMDFYKEIVSKFKNNLNKNGCFIFEIGYDQEQQIKDVAFKNGFDYQVKKDYSGNPRVAILTK